MPTICASNVVIAGGSGFVGTRLAKALVRRGDSVTVLSRGAAAAKGGTGKVVQWAGGNGSGDAEVLRRVLGDADAVVNLCGEPVVTRWSDAARTALVNSRVDSTKALVDALAALNADADAEADARRRCLVNASAVGYYGFAMGYDTAVDEGGKMGDDFLARLCGKWEAAAARANGHNVRTVVVRLGIVLGANGGALAKMVPAFQLFAGGPLGSGRQWVPWVHVDDVVASIVRSIDTASMSGVYNCAAPNCVTMAAMCDALASALKRPNLLAVPAFVLKLVLGEASCVLLEGQKVVPKRLLDDGYKFQYDNINVAMQAVVRDL